MNPGDKLMLNLRIAGQPRDLLESPAAFDVRDGVLVLYADMQGHALPYAGYSLAIVEHFEVIPADQVDDVEAKLKQEAEMREVDLRELSGKVNPFRGGKLKFKEDAS